MEPADCKVCEATITAAPEDGGRRMLSYNSTERDGAVGPYYWLALGYGVPCLPPHSLLALPVPNSSLSLLRSLFLLPSQDIFSFLYYKDTIHHPLASSMSFLAQLLLLVLVNEDTHCAYRHVHVMCTHTKVEQWALAAFTPITCY